MVTKLRALEQADMLIPHLFYHLVDYELKFVQEVVGVISYICVRACKGCISLDLMCANLCECMFDIDGKM